MHNHLDISSHWQKFHWLDIAEMLLIAGSLGGTVASLISQQLVFASVPLSLSVALNFGSRRRYLHQLTQENQAIADRQAEHHQENQSQYQLLSTQLEEAQQIIYQLDRDRQKLYECTQTLDREQEGLLSNFEETRQHIRELGDRTQTLTEQQKQLEQKVTFLSEIENLTHTIQTNSQAEFYYARGLNYQYLGNTHGAIEDYTQAIQLQPNHAQAYNSRGVLHLSLGNKREAVEDLRTAAKFYFEQGDLSSYQKARDLCQEVHDLNQPKEDTTPNLTIASFLLESV